MSPSQTNYHQTCKLKATMWTALHIGCGLELGRWEYFFNRQDELVFLDYDLLANEAVENPILIDKLTQAASQDHSGSLAKYMRKLESSDPQIRDRFNTPRRTRRLPDALKHVKEEERSIRRLRLFNGSPRCYIPGSSIKGAIRTALLSADIMNATSKEEYLPRDPSVDDFTNLKMLRERMARTFRANASETRYFQNIIVRDTAALEADKMGIASVSIFAPEHETRTSRNRNSDEYAEVALSDATVELSLTLRAARMSEGSKDIWEILKRVDHFYRRIWEEERLIQLALQKQNKATQDLLDFYNDENKTVPDDCYLLRMGYGAGQLTNSVLLDYREHYEKTLSKNADAPLRHSFLYTRKRPDLKKRTPYPFTSRSALAGSELKRQPLGWIAISKDF